MNYRPLIIAVMLAALVLLVSKGGVPVIGGDPAPFKTDKPCVMVVEETAERGKLTNDQLNVLMSTDAKSVKATVESAGGEFQIIDDDTPADKLPLYAPWVQEAFKVKRDSVPWILGANRSTGFSVPLITEADALKRTEGLK